MHADEFNLWSRLAEQSVSFYHNCFLLPTRVREIGQVSSNAKGTHSGLIAGPVNDCLLDCRRSNIFCPFVLYSGSDFGGTVA